MTNAPERFLSWRFDPNDRNSVPVSYVKDNRKQNCGTFILSKEDHTIGNLVRSRLVEDKNVRFAGYRVPHPLINECHVRIETIDKSNPRQAFENALIQIQDQTQNISDAFEKALQEFNY